MKISGALHYGPIPTFDDDRTSLEIFLLDFEGKEQIGTIEFAPLWKVREIMKFSSRDELKKQLERDIAEIKTKI